MEIPPFTGEVEPHVIPPIPMEAVILKLNGDMFTHRASVLRFSNNPLSDGARSKDFPQHVVALHP